MQAVNTLPSLPNKYLGRKIENSFQIVVNTLPTQAIEPPQKQQQAISNSTLPTGKKAGGLSLGGVSATQILKNSENQSTQEKQQVEEISQKKDENSINHLSLHERRQQKKLELLLQQQQQKEQQYQKPIQQQKQPKTSQTHHQMNDSSDEGEDFYGVMAPKKQEINQKLVFQQMQQQQVQQQQQQIKDRVQSKEEIIIEEKKQSDIEDIIKRTHTKFKNDKKMQEIEAMQKAAESQKLKDKLKKQEEEIRKRNMQKTQQFQQKKKKEILIKEQIDKQQQSDEKQDKSPSIRKKSKSKKRDKSIVSSDSKSTNQYDRYHERKSFVDINDSSLQDKSESSTISKEQFDLATKIRVKELMKKQKEEKEREQEEREKKRQKLEMVRQEQLIQLQKSKIKTKEQEDEERRITILNNKRIGGGGGTVGSQQNVKRASHFYRNNHHHHHLNQQNSQISESFLKEHIQKSIKQMYPNCSQEELIKLESEYKRQFLVENVSDSYRNQEYFQQQNIQNQNNSGTSYQGNNILTKVQNISDIELQSINNTTNSNFIRKQIDQEIEFDISQNSQISARRQQQEQQQQSQYLQQQHQYQQQQQQQQQEQLSQEESVMKMSREEYLKRLYDDAQSHFSPEEMIDFDKYIQQKLEEGALPFSDQPVEEQEDQYESYYQQQHGHDESEEYYENSENIIQRMQQSRSNDQIISESNYQKKAKSSSQYSPDKMAQNKSPNTLEENRENHHLSDLSSSSTKRGRSQRPKSCLAKETKDKRNKTVTFDGVQASANKNDSNFVSPSSSYQQFVGEKYGIEDFDDFNERVEDNKENKREMENKSDQYYSIQNQEFEKKVKDIKDLVRQYSGDKRLSLESSENNCGSFFSNSNNASLRLSHLKNSSQQQQQQQQQQQKLIAPSQQQTSTLNSSQVLRKSQQSSLHQLQDKIQVQIRGRSHNEMNNIEQIIQKDLNKLDNQQLHDSQSFELNDSTLKNFFTNEKLKDTSIHKNSSKSKSQQKQQQQSQENGQDRSLIQEGKESAMKYYQQNQRSANNNESYDILIKGNDKIPHTNISNMCFNDE